MKVVILGVDDWAALYINGEKKEENHSLHANFVLRTIEEEFKQGEDCTFIFQDYLYEGEEYPDYTDKLEDVNPVLREGIVI